MRVPKYFFAKRKIDSGEYTLDEIFDGLENVSSLKKVFGKKLKPTLKNTKVRIVNKRGYPEVSLKGKITISKYYLRHEKRWVVYLDIIHELIHIRQYQRGMKMHHAGGLSYVKDPLEIEAYKYTLIEAKKIGVKKQHMCDYLNLPWLTQRQSLMLFAKLCEKIN